MSYSYFLDSIGSIYAQVTDCLCCKNISFQRVTTIESGNRKLLILQKQIKVVNF